jgi:hypothetical protein
VRRTTRRQKWIELADGFGLVVRARDGDNRDAMTLGELVAWAWRETPPVHENRTMVCELQEWIYKSVKQTLPMRAMPLLSSR